MIRTLCLLATLAAPVSLFAQGAASANQTPAGQGTSTVVMPGTNVYVVGGGLYGTGVYVQGGSVAPAPNAGISLAGRTGISLNEPMQLGVQSTLVPSWPPYANGVYPVYAGDYYGVSPGAVEEESGLMTPRRAVRDLGPSYAADEQPQASSASVGEIADYYKANAHQNVRTYTNADAQRLVNTVIIPRPKAKGTRGATPAPPPQTTPPHR